MADRIAIVTGGGTGIGAASAVALAQAGWHVVCVGRRMAPLSSLVREHADLTLQAQPVDVTEETAVRALFDAVLAEHGRVDLLFNNAGRSAPPRDPDEVLLEEWDDVVRVNLTGTFLCTREAFRVMRRQHPRGGRIINNGSISAHSPRPQTIAYTATKHAITGLTKSTALDGRAYDIDCGQIDVGNAATEMTVPMAAGIRQADGSVRVEPLMPVSAVADAVVYMAGLPLGSNVATMTVLASGMPYLGRG